MAILRTPIPKLRPCPFCGDRVYLESRGIIVDRMVEMTIFCGICGYRMRISETLVSSDDVLAIWNRRAGDE